jgi:hypothetical protein
MSSEEAAASDAEILNQIRHLAAGISDERTRRIIQNTTGALELNPQPIPPSVLRSLLEAVALNPQPLPPSSIDQTETGNR